ncbi:MAG: NADH-quinone oxidoreductase subunit NuoG [Pseudomonadales bacterium]|nr:NADH-quinone oxidoreductase subunit NuoG [Pseudomonadales bacterium]
MAKINIDGEVYEVDPKNNLLQECLSEALDLPYFCWHPAMGSVGACRQCAVIEYANDEDQKGRVVMSCMTAPREGARYSIEKAAAFRANVIESLMISHPHDCPVCEEGGECHLQDMTVMSGHTYRRYDGKKVTHRNQDLGPFINHEMNRCITCYRCVRFYGDYAGGTDLTAQASHHNTYFGRYQEGTLESEFSGNLAEVCPTGVFTDKPFSEHYTRKWDLQTAPSLCAGCGVGCNINPGERYGTLRRVVNRFNEEVNGYFLCDRGRFGAGYVNSDERLRDSMTRTSGSAAPVLAPASAARDKLHAMASAAIGIGSPRASMEANYALRERVGADNFYAGVSAAEFALLNQILTIYQQVPANIPSIRDIENSDVVLILGEDVTNTAARMALALRQSVKNIATELAEKAKFPLWHDAAIRQLTMDRKSPLFILSPHATRLDDVAAAVQIGTAADSAKLGFAIAHAIDSQAPAVKGLSKVEQTLVETIANSLKGARQALIVSGTGSMSPALIDAAANIATALAGKGENADAKAHLCYVVPEANSLGLALLMQGSSNDLNAAFSSGAKQAIVLENDLYRRAATVDVDNFIQGLEQLAVIDSLKTRTGEQAHLVLAAATFAESAGTYVNYEGRAQHFYSVFKPIDSIRPSTSWLSQGMSLNELTAACAEHVAQCAGMAHLTPGPDYNIAGLKAPRQSHRYSGRTAMRANINVHEPKQEQDENGVMVYSMEGVPATRDAAVFNTPWAPGWNSNQSVFKFETEVGGALKQASHGQRLLTAGGSEKIWFDANVPGSEGDGLDAFPLYHLFGSDELSAHTTAIQARATSAYVALNPADAENLGLQSGDGVQLEHNAAVPFIIRNSIKAGSIGVSVGLAGLNIHNLPARLSLSKAEAWKSPAGWRAANIIVSDKRSV